MSSVLLEARSFRPFKSSEEYLYAMKEDLAEWLQSMYPHLNICLENFMERLETGVALCEHANAVKAQAQEYVVKKRAKMVMTRSVTGSLAVAQDLFRISEVKFFNTAKPGTFFARDNVSNFINWCRNALRIIECLLFESDDLIMRKNEKHVILCLLEVARRGAKFGMPAPMLVQMERQIDREIAADQKKMGISFNENAEDDTKFDDDSDSDMEDEETVLMYGPAPQIITNDLKCLDDMVRDLVEQCTCPTQFPMIKVSDGKYRIGDTKVLIFVRVLRNHVMVRVGGGWDTLSHYLDKHDPCRCRSQHRTTQGAKFISKPGTTDLHGSHVYYNRAPVSTAEVGNNSSQGFSTGNSLGPPMNSLNRSRSRSPSQLPQFNARRSVSPNTNKSLLAPERRSRSPTPNFTSTYLTKLSTKENGFHYRNSGPQSLPIINSTPKSKHVSSLQIEMDPQVLKSEAVLHVNDTDHSDSTSEMSDEGYRSLGIIQDKSKQLASFQQNSIDAVDGEHQQIYTGDDLNDCGLRKTQFSYIYENDIKGRLENNMHSVENLTEPQGKPTSPSHEDGRLKTFVSKPKENATPRRKERSFIATSTATRTNSGPKSLPAPKKAESKINTWSGRPKNSRHSLTAETFVSPFARNSSGRRSTSALNPSRRSSSANSSPTKSKFKQDLIETVKKTDDETLIVEVQELLKRYGSFNTLDNEEYYDKKGLKSSMENLAYSPRKDSRPNTNLSRIPAPKFFPKA